MTTAMTTTGDDLVSMLHDIRRPRRHIDRWIGAALIGLVALALGTLWVLDQRTKTTQFTLDDALTKLHETATASPAPGTTAEPSSVGATSTASDARGPASDPVPVPARRSTDSAAPAGPGTGMPLPAAGVYTYATSGGEKVSMLGAKHDYPARTHSIITHAGGCGWTIEHRVIEEHVDRFGRCSTNGTFQLTSLGREIEFFSQRDGLDYTCQSPFEWVATTDIAGSTHRAVCAAEHDQVVMDLKVIGRGTRTVGGTTVSTISYVAEWKMTGQTANGWARTETTIDAATGLMLHEHRVVDTDAHAPFGDVRYSEDVTFELLSMTPQT